MVVGVALAGLALIAAVLGYVVREVARAVGQVGSSLVNPPPHPEPQQPADTRQHPNGAERLYQPPWENWGEPGAETSPAPRDAGGEHGPS